MSPDDPAIDVVYKSILDSALDCIIVIDEDAKVLDFNAAAERTFGYTRLEAQGRRISELIIPPHMRPLHEQGMETWRQTGVGPVLDQRICVPAQDKSGEVFEVELTVTAVETPPRRTLFAAYLRDLRSTREVEENLRISEFSLDSLSDSMFLVEPDGTIKRVNAAACRALGYERDELVGKKVFDIDAVMTAEMWGPHWENLRAKGSMTIDSVHVRSDGRHFPVEVSVNFVDIDGKELNCAVARDVSERVLAEQKLKRAIQVAEEASRAKTDFLAKVSHELRTPLTAILGYVDMMSHSASRTGESGRLERVASNSRYLLHLVSDILDLSRIEAGQIKVSAETFELERLLSSIETLAHPIAAEKGIEFEIEVLGDVPSAVELDGMRLRQILFNLVENALKFTETGGVIVVVQHSRERLEFNVQDTGIGIDARNLDLIFEPFTQVNNKSELRRGTGLGLNISQRLARMLGGNIEVTSSPNNGSDFRVHVRAPAAEGAMPLNRTAETEPSRPTDEETWAPLSGLRVFVADDNPDNREIIRYHITESGAESEFAEDGREALIRLSERHDFDVALMDMHMPIMNGYEVTRRLVTAGDTIPIIAVTAFAMKEDRDRCLAAGCAGYVAKPIERATLCNEINRVLKRGDGEAATGQDPRREESESFKRLLQGYRSRLEESASVIEELALNADIEGLAHEAHRLRGTGTSFGFPDITKAATRIIADTREGILDEASVADFVRLLRSTSIGT